MLIDTHCHLDFPDFAAERDDIVARAHAAGVKQMITISTRVKKFPTILAIAEKYPSVFCSVGTHPHNADEELDISVSELVELSNHPRVVAIGEAGLDYFYDNAPREAQAIGLVNHIAADKWLLSYGTSDGLKTAFERISHRSPVAAALRGAEMEIERRQATLQAAFDEFYPQAMARFLKPNGPHGPLPALAETSP